MSLQQFAISWGVLIKKEQNQMASLLALPVPQIVDAILAAATEFSEGEMRDDLTLVVARGR